MNFFFEKLREGIFYACKYNSWDAKRTLFVPNRGINWKNCIVIYWKTVDKTCPAEERRMPIRDVSAGYIFFLGRACFFHAYGRAPGFILKYRILLDFFGRYWTSLEVFGTLWKSLEIVRGSCHIFASWICRESMKILHEFENSNLFLYFCTLNAIETMKYALSLTFNCGFNG